MKLGQIIDLLGITLPALIILFGIARVFFKKTKGINALTMLFAFLLLIIGLIHFFRSRKGDDNGPKLTPLSVSKHSADFNTSIDQTLAEYFRLVDNFSKNDSALVAQSAQELQTALTKLKVDDLKVDSIIYLSALQPYENLKAQSTAIATGTTLAEKRNLLNVLSQELLAFISTIRYDVSKLYWLECVQAFGADNPGNWLSKNETGNNPYAKTDCIELKTTIDFLPKDSTGKMKG